MRQRFVISGAFLALAATVSNAQSPDAEIVRYAKRLGTLDSVMSLAARAINVYDERKRALRSESGDARDRRFLATDARMAILASAASIVRTDIAIETPPALLTNAHGLVVAAIDSTIAALNAGLQTGLRCLAGQPGVYSATCDPYIDIGRQRVQSSCWKLRDVRERLRVMLIERKVSAVEKPEGDPCDIIE